LGLKKKNTFRDEIVAATIFPIIKHAIQLPIIKKKLTIHLEEKNP